ncbi:alpha-L-fucosidase [Aeriscardovia aeriphila]|uniref:Alpha-L-fucosidase n=1 Tax=Aeriscardovia aeriphila TaxID=218139 RepID=A0A261FCD5_9BIFI|nr:alpha-L-fucosidase [Aeriscardovia aeriphila]
MYCRNCGSQLRPGAAFCGRCGTRVLQTPAQPAQAVAQQPVAQQAQPQYAAPAQPVQPAQPAIPPVQQAQVASQPVGTVQAQQVQTQQSSQPEIASLSAEIAHIPAQPEATGDETTFMMPLSQHPAQKQQTSEPHVQQPTPEPETQTAPSVVEQEEVLEPTTVQPPVESTQPAPSAPQEELEAPAVEHSGGVESELPVAPAPAAIAPQVPEPSAAEAMQEALDTPSAADQATPTPDAEPTPQQPVAAEPQQTQQPQHPAAAPVQQPAAPAMAQGSANQPATPGAATPSLSIKLPQNQFTAVLKKPAIYQRAGIIAGTTMAGAVIGVMLQAIMLFLTSILLPSHNSAITSSALSFKSILSTLVTGFGGTYNTDVDLRSTLQGFPVQTSQTSVSFAVELPLTIIGVLALVGALIGGIIAARSAVADTEQRQEVLLSRCITLAIAGIGTGIIVCILGALASSTTTATIVQTPIPVSVSSVSAKAFWNPLFLVVVGALLGMLITGKDHKPSLARLHYGVRTFVETSLLFYVVFTVLTIILFVAVAVVSKTFAFIPLIFVFGPLAMFQLMTLGSWGSFSVLGLFTFSTFSDFSSSVMDGLALQVDNLYPLFRFLPGSNVTNQLDMLRRNGRFAPSSVHDPAWIPLIKLALVLITFASLAAVAYSLARRMAADEEERNWKHTWVFPLLSAVTWGFICLAYTPLGLMVPRDTVSFISQMSNPNTAAVFSVFSSAGQISPAMIFWGALWAFAVEALARLVFLKMIQKKAQPAQQTTQAAQFAQPQVQQPQVPQAQHYPAQPQNYQAQPQMPQYPAQSQYPAQPQYQAQPQQYAAPGAYSQPQYAAYPVQPTGQMPLQQQVAAAPQRPAAPAPQSPTTPAPAQPAAPAPSQQQGGRYPQAPAPQYPAQPGTYQQAPAPQAPGYPQNPQDYQQGNNQQ